MSLIKAIISNIAFAFCLGACVMLAIFVGAFAVIWDLFGWRKPQGRPDPQVGWGEEF